MKLSEYFLRPGSLTVGQLRLRIKAKSDAQVRQWRDAYKDRRPSPIYAVAIERETEGLVSRKVWYPMDWMHIWPELEHQAQEVEHG